MPVVISRGPLMNGGLKAAPYMAALLKEKKVIPELVIASPANRALCTAELFCEILGYPKELIQQQIEIYEGGAGQLLKIVQQINDSCNTAMIFTTTHRQLIPSHP